MSQQMDMKTEFYKNLSPSVYETPAREKERTLMFTDEEYSNQIRLIKEIKHIVRKVGACESLFSYKLDLATVNGRDRLILRAKDDSDSYTIYVPTSEMFDIIHEHHLATGHGVPRVPQLYCVLNTIFANITEGTVGLYLKLCETCSKRKYVVSKTMDPWSKLACEDLAPKKSRAILNIIDMRDEKSEKYQYIMCYTVSSTGFVLLKPLKTTREKEISSRLIDAFAILGTPIILNSTVDSSVFNDRLINKLYEEWPDAKVVCGRPTEYITKTVKKQTEKLNTLLQMWIRHTRRDISEWPKSLNWIQFRMNNNPDISYDNSGDHTSAAQSSILTANTVPIFKRPMNSVVARQSKRSDGEITVGTRVLISAFQRCNLQLNPAFLPITIVHRYQGYLYMLGTEKGLINYKFERKHLTPCNIDTPIKVNVNRSKIISLHDAFGAKACPKGVRVAKCKIAECLCHIVENFCNYRSHGMIPSYPKNN